MIQFVTETYGNKKRNKWIKLLATTVSLEDATVEAMRITFDQLSTEMQTWLAAQE